MGGQPAGGWTDLQHSAAWVERHPACQAGEQSGGPRTNRPPHPPASPPGATQPCQVVSKSDFWPTQPATKMQTASLMSPDCLLGWVGCSRRRAEGWGAWGLATTHACLGEEGWC